MSTLAQAYVQIIPSTKGISGAISKALGGESASAGKSSGESIAANLVSSLKGVLAAAGIGTIIKETLDAGGALQQSFGGIDTLYAGAEESMKSMARQAAVAGISANTYAEQAVSFGAALKQAYGGDAVQAAKAANQAILDMADNSAKMGTDIQSVQNAYQGFAKQNFTMLDNLKLGYGGTKSEMERLLAKANEIKAEQGEITNYSIDNFGDITEAIHVVQDRLDIAGVAAGEAEITFTGSFGAMSAAAQNLMADLALGENITADMEMLGQTVSSFLVGNFLPMLGNIFSGIPTLIDGVFTALLPQLADKGMQLITSLSDGITTSLPGMLQKGYEIVNNITTGVMTALPEFLNSANESATEFLSTITERLPELLDKGIEMLSNIVSGIISNLPALIESAGSMVNTFANFIFENLPTIQQKGVEMLGSVAQGVLNNLPALLNALVNVLTQFLATITNNLPQMLQKGIEIIGQVAAGIINAIPTVLSACKDVIDNILNKFKDTDWKQIGKNIIEGIKQGIVNAAHMIYDAIRDVAEKALDTVTDFFDIGSPSKLMANEVGRWIPAGIAVGIEDNIDPLTAAMDEVNAAAGIGYAGAIASQPSYSASVETGSGGMNEVISLLERYLPNIGSDIYMDGAKVGKIVNKRLGMAL
jgi:phage-related protein